MQKACVERLTKQKLLLSVAKSPCVEGVNIAYALGLNESLTEQSGVRQLALRKLDDPNDIYDVAVNAKDENVPVHAVKALYDYRTNFDYRASAEGLDFSETLSRRSEVVKTLQKKLLIMLRKNMLVPKQKNI